VLIAEMVFTITSSASEIAELVSCTIASIADQQLTSWFTIHFWKGIWLVSVVRKKNPLNELMLLDVTA